MTLNILTICRLHFTDKMLVQRLALLLFVIVSSMPGLL